VINLIAKGLVLFHTTISLLAMTWALHLVLSAQDFGWAEPYKEVTEYDAEGNEKSLVRHASHIDKSQAALINAKNTRDVTYVHVKPAIDQVRETEPFLAANHLHYLAEMKRLKEATGEIEVKRFKDGGNVLDTPGNLGKPALEDKAIPELKKSYKTYGADLKGLFDDIDKVEDEIKTIARDTKKITADLTGTDEANKYVQPGLYQLTDLEFKAQSQLKVEIDDIKPRWSKAIQNAQLYQTQRIGLEDTLQKLMKQPAPPMAPKVEKK
jgi:hypothetical protein